MKALVALCLFALPVAAQPFSFGLKAGTPVNDAINNDGGKFSFNHSTGRWIVGPTVELRLPFGIGIEADALYRRYTIGGSVNHWEFPILAKYRFAGISLVRPFVDAGPSFNHVSNPGFSQVLRHVSAAGFAIGGGLEIKALLVRLSPELRYTRWNNQNISFSPLNSGLSSSQNQLDFLVGITF